MCKLYTDWRNEIREYCAANGLDFSRVEKAGKCWGKDVLMLQHIDARKGTAGLHDETPAPVLLVVRKQNNSLMFEQTENTRKYLGMVHQ